MSMDRAVEDFACHPKEKISDKKKCDDLLMIISSYSLANLGSKLVRAIPKPASVKNASIYLARLIKDIECPH
jgi:hypothetical protein